MWEPIKGLNEMKRQALWGEKGEKYSLPLIFPHGTKCRAGSNQLYQSRIEAGFVISVLVAGSKSDWKQSAESHKTG